MNTALFRKISLDRLSSPEQLDQLLRITDARMWISLAAVSILLVAAVTWGFEGDIVTTATGTGVVVRRGGVLNIVANGNGAVQEITVLPGSQVIANQVIATIAQPALVQQLKLLEDAREQAERRRDQDLQVATDAAALKLEANTRQHSNGEAEISELEEKGKLLDQQIAVEQELFHKGLVTNQQVLDMRQQLITVKDQIASSNAQIRQLDADRFAIKAQPRTEDAEKVMRVAELDRQIAAARQNLALAQRVISPYAGEVLEVKASPGSSVIEGQPLVSIQPRRGTLEMLAYVPSLLAKDVRAGMETEVSPSNVKREEYGFIRGKVDFVADYPATQAAIMRSFENDALVHTVNANGAVTEIHAALRQDLSTPSGFVWSTSRGPDVLLTSGTICQVDIVTRRQKPISLVFPYLRSKFGS